MPFLDMVERYRQSGTHKFYSAVPDDHVLGKSEAAGVLVQGKHYFSIRLCEMFLKNKTNYISGFIPMTVALNMFTYAGAPCTVPVLVGNQMLQSVEPYIRDQDIEIINTPVLGPLPYCGANVGFFIGLYRVAVDNLAKNLFNLIDNFIGVFKLTDLSGYLSVAKLIGEGLEQLIGLPQIKMRFGNVNTFGGSGNPFRDCYLLYINSPEGKINRNEFWVEDSRLKTGEKKEKLRPFTDEDYCLVRIEKLESRPDIDTLPFHKLFLDSKTNLWEGNMPEADRLFLTLMRDLARSPDLTSSDRNALMQTYMANYQQEKANHETATSILKKTGRRTVRGAAAVDAMAAVQRTAGLVEKSTIPKPEGEAVRQSLDRLAQCWDTIPHLQERQFPLDLDKAMLYEQFNAIKATQEEMIAPPEALADAISFAAFQ